jgi:ADP-ribose pyrophosphatase
MLSDHPPAMPAFPRPWDTPAPGYTPIDITPPELTAAGIAASDGWAEPALSPTDVSGWSLRQAYATVPFDVVDGYPRNPAGRTGKVGRNLGRWGENTAADAIVVADTSAGRHLLMIRRDDCGLWALPGGMADPGERPRQTAVRELAEETGLDLAGRRSTQIWSGVVDDPRNTDHAWVASTAHLFHLRTDHLPPVIGNDDAIAALWWRCKSVMHLVDLLGTQRRLFTAHLPLLWAAHRVLDAEQP